MLTRKFEDGKSADLPSSSVDQDIVKRKTNRLRRQNTAIHKLDDAIVRIKLVTVQNREAELTAGKAEEVKARRRKRGIYDYVLFPAFCSSECFFIFEILSWTIE